MRPHLFALPLAIALLVAAPLQRAFSQGLLDHPVRILTPVAPGGTSDIAARLLAAELTRSLGRPFVVENRVGATGRIAAKVLKDAAPDGTTLLLAPIVVAVIAPFIFERLDYDPVRDFAPVAQVATYQFAFAVTPGLPVRSVPEFVRWAKAHPSQANFASPAVGSVPHFFGVMIREETGVEMVHVPYSSLAQLKIELASGKVASGVSALSDFTELHRAGAIRIIGTSGARRSPLLPDVPTFGEEGFPTVGGSGWTAVFAPAGTPALLVDQLSRAIVAAVRAPAVADKLTRLGVEPTGTTPQELAEIMAADSVRWSRIIKASGFEAK